MTLSRRFHEDDRSRRRVQWLGQASRCLKPNPEPYLRVAELLDVAPSKCIVFEDSIAGLIAARNAGMTCVGVETVALAAEGNEAPDMAITTFEGFDIWNVHPV